MNAQKLCRLRPAGPATSRTIPSGRRAATVGAARGTAWPRTSGHPVGGTLDLIELAW